MALSNKIKMCNLLSGFVTFIEASSKSNPRLDQCDVPGHFVLFRVSLRYIFSGAPVRPLSFYSRSLSFQVSYAPISAEFIVFLYNHREFKFLWKGNVRYQRIEILPRQYMCPIQSCV